MACAEGGAHRVPRCIEDHRTLRFAIVQGNLPLTHRGFPLSPARAVPSMADGGQTAEPAPGGPAPASPQSLPMPPAGKVAPAGRPVHQLIGTPLRRSGRWGSRMATRWRRPRETPGGCCTPAAASLPSTGSTNFGCACVSASIGVDRLVQRGMKESRSTDGGGGGSCGHLSAGVAIREVAATAPHRVRGMPHERKSAGCSRR